MGCVALTAALAACENHSGDTHETTKSSAGHQLRLVGEMWSRPRKVFAENIVTFESLGGAPGRKATLYRADSRDDSFRDEYPSEEWATPNVMRFIAAGGSMFHRDTLKISNATSQTIEHLMIQAGDLLIILDLDPNQNVSVDVPAGGWLGVSGVFRDGAVLKPSSVDIREPREGHRVVTVEVRPEGTIVRRD